MEPREPLPERPIAWLGRYALFDELARGGMATVHIGRLSGPAGFSKTVAIKKMHAALAQDPQFQAMFLDEARLASRIQHPNVVPVLDVIAERHEAYLVMEYVEGESLAMLCRAMNGQRIAPSIAAHIGRDVLYGLHAAHEAASEQGRPLELVHRDVSPQNILVGADGVARVLDFGVAKAVGRLQDTDTGQIKGKVSYMAPEQVLGQTVDRRADIFAAGVVLWEALSGKRLFAGSNSAESMYRVLEEAIPRLSEVVADLPEALVAAVERATRKDARERFETALEFANALEQSVELIPNRVVGQWVGQVAGETLKRKRERLRAIESVAIPTDDSDDFDVIARPTSTSAAYVRGLPDDATRADAPITVRTRPERVPRSSRIAFGLTALATATALAGWWAISGPAAPSEIKLAVPAASVEVAKPASPRESPVSGSAGPETRLAPSSSTPAASVVSLAAPAASQKPRPKTPATKPKPRPESLFSRQ